jgi:hypothetical protein
MYSKGVVSLINLIGPLPENPTPKMIFLKRGCLSKIHVPSGVGCSKSILDIRTINIDFEI